MMVVLILVSLNVMDWVLSLKYCERCNNNDDCFYVFYDDCD